MFDAAKFAESKVSELSALQGEGVIAVSGGVDSTVAALLVLRAVGPRLHCVFVDTGLLRKGEAGQAMENFAALGLSVKKVDASQRFFSALEGVGDPEAKRKIIGEAFIRVFEEEAKASGAQWLAQGTIAPDWLESGSGSRDNIKSHHNVGGLPEKFGLRLVEPLRDLYKDEVRLVGKALGLHEKFYNRQPFPGPGLAVRVLGEVTMEKVALAREACAIVEEELESAASRGECAKPWQYYAALLPVRSVGVQGDKRAYGWTVVVRAVDSGDALTATCSEIPHAVLKRISTRICNELKQSVNRVVFDLTDKPPGTIEWE
ncbi:GMP synthase [Candidatus Micrarchaeota archaeon CG_4_10_14_0_2_um_filter_60_11]|nr:MAG: GMP synthase [Candidatus Micrarchaeota archaeon CG1_02_60_51]PIN96195.1 MAG: GMP synthase [Candidatus Micrarchaeota archaeon CG10_big_fil_rev_8_21_14_0_10_60_32]PIO01633.1 MAG: GMP synthase [Candidatus Micrarchaeota archaeon CG09_land_8_20_14_0_10_60_16]PIY91479.1 MAG: GMP synthase [Candidatus Micrarchaeota archaeon CG_4_10_14_0_8_um_filter_60_7]PIZ90620.1 MAG: GMP synthase [Candidatus Micrarchaeota archaeon CG_4_10_14_0_2_um_filter_60_11]